MNIIFFTIKRVVRVVVVRAIKIFAVFVPIKFARAVIFDISQPKNLLVANAGGEVYVVHAADKAISRSVYVNSGYDFEKFEHVIRLLGRTSKVGLLVDVGANIGTICIPAVKRDLVERAIAIEPESKNFNLLSANVLLNGVDGKIAKYNMALGDKLDDVVNMQLSESNYGDHRVVRSDACKTNVKYNTIKSTTLDSIVQTIDPANTLIWVDTQGYEGYVLSGAKNLLNLHVPIVLEFWPHGMSLSNSFQLFKESLINAGYKKFIDLERIDNEPVPLTYENLDRLYFNLGEDGAYSDILVY